MRILLAILATSGLFGHVTRAPTQPVCKLGKPCSAPVVGARLEFLRNGVLAGSALTMRGGTYRVKLAPGRYAVRLGRPLKGPQSFAPRTVRVPPGPPVRVDFSIDTGIR
jgi:hypothetical protein